ncbi:hypothetical protein SAMN05518865_11034 [Duganella sp. CF458]|uniref:hypothetical protein n=1 Tax=Duganella sp. CF458 TaxID=1884368 RepID=UPI0008F439F8|nr:hypothetical protein [Duganella sp. CF458]SFG25966.1 hypothetical protein SAMN05518865_11034 [Duganella sp. CF458]
MKPLPHTTLVPELSACATWQEVCNFVDISRGAGTTAWTCAAQYAMVLAARNAVGTTNYFEDALQVVNSLARAKAEIDIVSWHANHVIAETQYLLRAAQDFLDQNTIACNEWPRPQEIADEVENIARRRAAGNLAVSTLKIR